MASDLREHRRLQLGNAGFVALVECPLLDPLGAEQPGLRQDLECADGRLADAELFGDQHAADFVLHEIAIHLRGEMRLGTFQPFQN